MKAKDRFEKWIEKFLSFIWKLTALTVEKRSLCASFKCVVYAFIAKKGDKKMETLKLYVLPKLAYDYNALAPIISEDLLRLHHDKHHAAYVNGRTLSSKRWTRPEPTTSILTRRRRSRNSRSTSGATCSTHFFGITSPHQAKAGARSRREPSRKLSTRSSAPSIGSKSCFRRRR